MFSFESSSSESTIGRSHAGRIKEFPPGGGDGIKTAGECDRQIASRATTPWSPWLNVCVSLLFTEKTLESLEINNLNAEEKVVLKRC